MAIFFKLFIVTKVGSGDLMEGWAPLDIFWTIHAVSFALVDRPNQKQVEWEKMDEWF